MDTDCDMKKWIDFEYQENLELKQEILERTPPEKKNDVVKLCAMCNTAIFQEVKKEVTETVIKNGEDSIISRHYA